MPLITCAVEDHSYLLDDNLTDYSLSFFRKKNEKLDWMYAGHQVNHEEYLLGRKIDKNVEILKEADDTPVRYFHAIEYFQ